MQSFGDKLKQEREARDMTIEEIALATGIQLGYLQALESNEFHSLPGHAFGKLYIRAYAEVLRFDPRSLIEDYDRERIRRRPAAVPNRVVPDRPRRVKAAIARWREEKIQERQGIQARGVAPAEVPEPPEPVEAPREDVAAPDEHEVASTAPAATPSSHRTRHVVLLSCGLLGLALIAAIFVFARRDEESGRTRPIEAARAKPPAPVEPAPVQKPVEVPSPQPKTRPPVATAPPHLEVAEFGVGRRIVEGRLEDREDAFAQGDVAWFSTRVLGGTRGGRVRHVWLLDGRLQQTIQLRLSGPSWHTYSSKRLGKPGSWAVEARDPEGRVLARATFACLPAGARLPARSTP